MTAAALQELSFFSGLENDAKKLAGDAWSGANACYANAACKATVEKYGVKAGEAFMKKEALMNLGFFSGLENDAKKLAGDAWSGANACYANAACKATVEKYGVKAGEAFMKHEALQELSFGSFFHHVEDDAKKAVQTVEPIAKYAAGKAW